MAALAIALALAQGMSLAEIKKLDLKAVDWEARITRFIGAASDTDAARAWDYYEGTIRDRWEQEQGADNVDPTWAFRTYNLLMLGRAEGIKYAKHIMRPGPDLDERLMTIAAGARRDFPMEIDRVYYWPYCGTYDHGEEYKLSIAVELYRLEYMKLLANERFDGRTMVLKELIPWWNAILGVKPDPALRPILVKLATDANVLVRGQALLGLSHFPGADTDRLVAAALHDKYMDTRVKAMDAAGARGQAAVAPVVIKFLSSEEWDEKRHAAQCLAKLRSPDAIEAFIRALEDPKTELEYVQYAKGSNVTEALPFLIRTLAKDKDNTYVYDAILALDPNGRRDRIQSVLKSQNQDLLWTAIGAAEEYKVVEALPLLRGFLKTDTDYARKAFGAIIELDPNNAAETIMEALSGTNADMIYDAIGEAQRRKLASAVPAIRAFLAHEDPSVRSAARSALDKLAPPP